MLDNERLPEPLRQPLTNDTRMNVGRAAGRIADDDAHRPRRIGLCACNLRDSRQRGSARGQMQKSTTGKFHDVPPMNLLMQLLGSVRKTTPIFDARGRWLATAYGPLQMPRPATLASGYRGTPGATLTFDCNSHSINQKDA
jgi:hypothetical protein